MATNGLPEWSISALQALASVVAPLAGLALLCAVADVWKGVQPRSLEGPPPPSRLRAAAAVLALGCGASAALAAAAGRSGPALWAAVAAAAFAAALSAGWGMYRRYSPALNRPGLSLREKTERARVGFLISVLGVPAAIALHVARNEMGPLGRHATVAVAGALALGIAVVETIARRRLSRWDEEPNDELLARAMRIAPWARPPIRSAAVDGAWTAHPTAEFTLSGGRLTVSRHAAECCTPGEMDFAIAYLAAHAATRPRRLSTALLVLAVAGAIGAIVWWFRQPPESDVALLAVMLACFGLSAAVSVGETWGHRRADRGAALRALEATGDMEAADGAILKMAGGEFQAVAFTKARAQACIGALRLSSGERGLAFSRKRPIDR